MPGQTCTAGERPGGGGLAILGGQTQPKDADPGKAPGPRYTGSRTGERRKAAGLETAQAPRSRDLETSEIQAGFRLVGHRGVKKKARGKTTAQPGVTPVPGTPSASPHSLVSYWIDAGYEELGLFGSLVARWFPPAPIVVAPLRFLGAACP